MADRPPAPFFLRLLPPLPAHSSLRFAASRWLGYGLVIAALAGCAGPSSRSSDTGPGASTDRSNRPKTLTIAALRPVRAFGPWDGSGSGGTYALHNLHSSSLISTDLQANYIPRLLATLPSFDDRTMVVLPDGRLQTTWKLRSDIKWHDGAPMSAEDLVFTWQVLTDPDVALQQSVQVQQMQRVEAIDSTTALVTWKVTFFQSLYLGLREFWPFPKHLLGEAFAADRKAFANLPYWTTDFVNTGPYRLLDYGGGERLTFERFDDYFLGRPKIGTLVLKVFTDPNTLFANLLSGELDMVSENALPFELYTQLRDSWKQSGQGGIVERQANWRFFAAQFNPAWARSLELARDVRVRRGLLYGIDRVALREAVLPGFGDLTDGDTFMDRGDPRAPAVGKPYSRYPYDPARALQNLADAGWRRASDGRLLTQGGQQVQLAVRTNAEATTEVAVVAQQWRDLGIEVIEDVTPPALTRDREYTATFPSFEASARGSGDFTLGRFDSRQAPTPQNRYVGINSGGYANPTFDVLLDRLYTTIDESEQGALLNEIGNLLATDLPVLPAYFQVKMAAVVKGIRALTDDYAGSGGPGFLSRNAHLWDKD